MNTAREKVRVAKALEDLPKISAAFRNGEISYSKARAMTRLANEESEDYLLMIARNGTANHVETVVRDFRRAERLDDSADKQHDSRVFNYHWDDDGSLVFNGRLPAEVGAMLMKAMQASIDREKKEVPSEAREPIATKRAHAIEEMAESYLATGPAQSSSADRYQVMVHVYPEGSSSAKPSDHFRRCEGNVEDGPHVSAETSDQPRHRNAHIEDGPHVSAETSDQPRHRNAHIEDGPHVSAETSTRICCDTSTSLLQEDKNGEPLSIGRKSRVIPPAMRRALRARDNGCRFPGCTHRHFIDGHHIRHWADGGETSLDNLVQLCRHHHRLVHEGGFGCERNQAGLIEFRDREGIVIGNARTPPPRYSGNVVIGLREKLEDRFIDSETCVTGWKGERMDRDLAVSMLWDLKHKQPGTVSAD